MKITAADVEWMLSEFYDNDFYLEGRDKIQLEIVAEKFNKNNNDTNSSRD